MNFLNSGSHITATEALLVFTEWNSFIILPSGAK
jgi:hypothetical protein